MLPPPLHAGLHGCTLQRLPLPCPHIPSTPGASTSPLAHHLLGGTAPEHHKAHKGAGEGGLESLSLLCLWSTHRELVKDADSQAHRSY